jgi:cytochrome c biogenesis protein CcmG/thiol:disulfide interchange protein DsbE
MVEAIRDVDLGRRRNDSPGGSAGAAGAAPDSPAQARIYELAQGALHMSRASRFAPLALLLLIVVALVWRLATPADTNVHSTLEGKPVPAFALAAALPPKATLTSSDLATGRPRLLNIFASWCVPCIDEVKVLQELKNRGVAIEGIAVRDRPEDLAEFLGRNGDPYERIGSDPQSQVQIALGSSGVPESFIVDGKGIIRYQHVGPIEASDVPMILSKLEQAR